MGSFANPVNFFTIATGLHNPQRGGTVQPGQVYAPYWGFVGSGGVTNSWWYTRPIPPSGITIYSPFNGWTAWDGSGSANYPAGLAAYNAGKPGAVVVVLCATGGGGVPPLSLTYGGLSPAYSTTGGTDIPTLWVFDLSGVPANATLAGGIAGDWTAFTAYNVNLASVPYNHQDLNAALPFVQGPIAAPVSGSLLICAGQANFQDTSGLTYVSSDAGTLTNTGLSTDYGDGSTNGFYQFVTTNPVNVTWNTAGPIAISNGIAGMVLQP